jgi:hypothetical protein
MKAEILATLKTKYKDLGFSEKTLDGVAEYLSQTVKEKEQINAATTGIDSLLRVFQSENDRRASELQTTITELQKQIDSKKEEKGGAGEQKPNPDISQQITDLRSELESLRLENKKKEVRAVFLERAKAKKIPQILINSANVEDESKIDEVISDLETKANELKQELINEGLGGNPPARGSGAAGAKEQIIDDIKNNPIVVKK